MRAGLAALIIASISIPVLARAQADADMALTIPIHPRVSTILHLPDEIVHTWIEHHGEIRVARDGNKLYVQPRAGTRAGVEASLEVETRTLRRTFLLRVVRRARDASLDVVVPAVEAPPAVPATLMTPPTGVMPVVEAPDASTSTAAPSPAPAEPAAEPATAADPESATTATSASRFDLAAHAVLGTGLTGLEIAGYRSRRAVQPHHLVGLRLTGEPRDACWSLEAGASGELPAGPMEYAERATGSWFEVSGPRLRLEMGIRASRGTKWRASAYAGGGIQMHLRRIQVRFDETQSSETLERSGVLTLGMGLRYRARRNLLLGLEFQVRQGWPNDDYSMSAVLSVGSFLDQGD